MESDSAFSHRRERSLELVDHEAGAIGGQVIFVPPTRDRAFVHGYSVREIVTHFVCPVTTVPSTSPRL